MLKRNGFYKTFGDDWLFPSIKSAVDFAKAGERLVRYFSTAIVHSCVVMVMRG